MQYLHEHISCRNFEQHDRPTIECKTAYKGQEFKAQIIDNKIIFIVEGEFFVTFGKFADKLSKGKMILVPSGSYYKVQAKKDASYIICRLRNNVQLCDHFSLEKLFDRSVACNKDCQPLHCNEILNLYIESLSFFLKEGLQCVYYYELKIKELLFLLKSYYTKEELQHFFYPLLSNDLFFSDFVLKNHYKVRNVQELAELAHYSVSGFEKRFKKVFNVSAYKWMKEQKAKTILHEIHSSDKTFKEIGWEYGFSSPAQFSDFCKSNFGAPPGKIREEGIRELITTY